MEYLWRRGKLGELWLSKEAITSLANTVMPPEYKAREATLQGDDNVANVIVVAPHSGDLAVKKELQDKLVNLFAPLGLKVKISWTSKEESFDAPALMNRLRKFPIFWGSVVAIIAGISQLGLKGLGLCILFGFIGWAIAGLVISGKLSDLFSSLMDRRN